MASPYACGVADRARLHLPPETVRMILQRAGLAVGAGIRPRRVRSGNDVFKVDANADTLFLKVPAKDLEAWRDPLDGATSKVIRERAACQCLRAHGLPAPEVVAFDLSRENPIGRPYLLTRKVVGRPFTTLVRTRARSGWRGQLEAVGAFLAAVHAIEFEAPGYVTTPKGPLGSLTPEHPRASHAPAVAQTEALRDLAAARPFLDPGLFDALEERFGEIATSIAGEYWPPRFVIGGFHPNHPFLGRTDGRWKVTGCVDLEVASGGSVFDDLTTFAVGMMVRTETEIPWWEPLFVGYGSTPTLERFRIALLSSCTYCFGNADRPHGLEATYRALLAADSWSTLFNAHRAPPASEM